MAWRLLQAFVGLTFVFLLLPIVIIVITSFSASPGLVFPPKGLTLHWYGDISAEFLQALRTSVIISLGTTFIATTVGTPAALALVRSRNRLKTFISLLTLSPLTVSTLVLAVALFQYSGVLWDYFGVSMAGRFYGLMLGQAAFTIPFVIRAVVAGQAHFDQSIEEASLNLGATPWQTFFRITLPMLMPGIVSGAIFAFVMSFDDVPIALFLGGSDTITLPVKIYTSVEFSIDGDVMAVGSLVIAGSLACVLALERLIGLDKFLGTARA